MLLWNAARSASWTPRSSQIISEGKGRAYDGTRSASVPAARIAAMCSAAISVSRSSSARIRRTVNCPVSRLRRRVCSGGSMKMNIPSWRSGTSTAGAALPAAACSAVICVASGWRMRSLEKRLSASTARASSKPVTSHARAPLASGSGCTGSPPRRWTSPGAGSNGHRGSRSSTSAGITPRMVVGEAAGAASCAGSSTSATLPRIVHVVR